MGGRLHSRPACSATLRDVLSTKGRSRIVAIVILASCCILYLWLRSSPARPKTCLQWSNHLAGSPCGLASAAARNHTYTHNGMTITYVMSDLEWQWMSSIRCNECTACQAIHSQPEPWQAIITTLDLQQKLAGDGGHCATDVQAYKTAFSGLKAKEILSYIEVRSGSEERVLYTSFLEPLAGNLRDPRAICWGADWEGSKQLGDSPLQPRSTDAQLKYLLVDPSAVRVRLGAGGMRGDQGSTTPRALLFDIGASRWVDPVAGKDMPGVRWLMNAYGAHGMQFEHIYGWEAEPMTPAFWEGMPVEARHRIHFYNLPASPEVGHVDNPWSTLLAAARVEDYVVVKLDIDTPSVEMPLVQQLMEDDRLAALVDDFYFEHHVSMPEMHLYWGDRVQGTLSDSYDLFLALRKKGIRAHSWP